LSHLRAETREELTDIVQVTMERLWRCMSAPPVFIKRDVVISLLKSSPDMSNKHSVIEKMNDMTKAELGVCVLAKFCKIKMENNNFSEVYTMINKFNLGVVGSFVIRQNYQKGIYVGPGLYKGTFDGCKIEIKVYDNSIERISCESSESMKFCSNTVLEFIRAMNWKFLTNTKGADFWNFQYKMVEKEWGPKSSPIMFLQLTWKPEYEKEKLDIEVTDYGCIRLYSLDEERKSTVFSLKIKPRNLRYNYSLKPKNEKDVLDCWLNSYPADLSSIKTLINKNNDSEKWSIEQIRHRLVGLGRVPNFILEKCIEISDNNSSSNSSSKSKQDREQEKEKEKVSNREFTTTVAMAGLTEDEQHEFEEMFEMSSSSGDSSNVLIETDYDPSSRLFNIDESDLDFLNFGMLGMFDNPFVNKMKDDAGATNRFFDLIIQWFQTNLGSKSFYMIMTNDINLKDLISKAEEIERENKMAELWMNDFGM
jgi:hypothetical protein